MGTVSDLVTEITSNVDTSPADALIVLDRRHKLMCARARWHRLSQTIAVSTATNATYSTLAAPDLVEAFWDQRDRERLPRGFRPTEAVTGARSSTGPCTVRGRGGVFIESDETDETDTTPDVSLILYPAMDNAATVTLDGAFRPPTLTTAETAGSFVRVPVEFHDGLLAGVYASVLSRPSDSRQDLAAGYEQAFAAACVELRDRADRRYRTRGPRQIRVPSRLLTRLSTRGGEPRPVRTPADTQGRADVRAARLQRRYLAWPEGTRQRDLRLLERPDRRRRQPREARRKRLPDDI
jgi:hypothetical protein